MRSPETIPFGLNRLIIICISVVYYIIYDVTNNGKFLKIRNASLDIYIECKTWIWKSTEKYFELFFKHTF